MLWTCTTHHNGEGGVGLQGMQRGSAGRCRGCKGTGALGHWGTGVQGAVQRMQGCREEGVGRVQGGGCKESVVRA
jgi:hypothetical protein